MTGFNSSSVNAVRENQPLKWVPESYMQSIEPMHGREMYTLDQVLTLRKQWKLLDL